MNIIFAFVYAKDGKIKVLSHEQSLMFESTLKKEGWKHTATIDAFKWIEYVHNESKSKIKDVKSLSVFEPMK
jgi:hypothetical protein